MKKFDIEISGSKPIKKTAIGIDDLLEKTKHAQEMISVVTKNVEVFYGTFDELQAVSSIGYGYLQ